MSKLVKRTLLKLTRLGSPTLLMKSSTHQKRVLAQSGLGKPKIPEEMAGIDTDLHFSLQAQIRVYVIQEARRPTSSLLP